MFFHVFALLFLCKVVFGAVFHLLFFQIALYLQIIGALPYNLFEQSIISLKLGGSAHVSEFESFQDLLYH
jgi:hypothetical protein